MTTQHTPMPSRAAINHAEIQVFDNRTSEGPQRGTPGFRVKIGTLQAPLHEIERTHAQENFCPVMIPREFRKSITKRVSRGTMTAERAEQFREFSRLVPTDTFLGLVENLPSGSEQLCSAVIIDGVVQSVTLYLPDDELVLSSGEARREGADASAAIWRAHYDPHNWYVAHTAKLRAAHRRKAAAQRGEAVITNDMLGTLLARLQAAEDRLEIVEGDHRVKSAQIADLTAQLVERNAEVEQLIELATAHTSIIERLEARPATPSIMEADRPLTVEERTERARRQTDRMKADRAAASAGMVAEMAAQHEMWVAEGQA